MFTDRWQEFLVRTAHALSVSKDTVLLGVVLLGILVVFSLGVVAQVMMIGRERKLSLGSAVRYAFASIWAVPVLAVLACFAIRIGVFPQPAAPVVETRLNDTPGSALPFTPANTPPQWASESPIRRDSGNRLQSRILSARGASVADAERQLAAETETILRQEFPREFAAGFNGPPRLTAATARPLVTQRFVQPGYESVGEHRNEVRQVYWKLEFSARNRSALREAVAVPRLWIVGGIVAMLAMIVAGVSVYLRLDAATEGKYRFRLKLASTTLICTAGLLLTALLPVA